MNTKRIKRNNILRVYMHSIKRTMTTYEMEQFLIRFYPDLVGEPYSEDEFYSI